MMSKIHLLSPETISKIAAGEVIERSAFAIKELIENAIDANASFIDVQVEESGLKKIIVTDNGTGMNKEDLELCFLPHTTSKLSTDDDLVGVRTLGFRGEALSSIAAISHMTIQSREENTDIGYKVTVSRGKEAEVVPIGTPFGTRVSVDDLFYSVPARKKFLKSGKTELRLISNIILQFALCYPTIHFVFSHNKKLIFDLPPKKNNEERISFLLGNDFLLQMIELKKEENYIQIRGYIGHPQQASKGNNKQFLFVNNRLVSDKLISLAVKEAFGSLLPSSFTPTYLLFITTPPETIDVNVHPRKEQIAFINNSLVFETVKNAVIETLNNNNINFRLSKFKDDNSVKTGETNSFTGLILKQHVLVPEKISPELFAQHYSPLQIELTYILSVTPSNISLIDQHAAHERILYEKFLNEFITEKMSNNVYALPKPIMIDLSLDEKMLLDEYENIFIKTGFIFENTHNTTIIIKKIPSVFKGRNLKKIINDMLIDLSQEKKVSSVDRATERLIAFLACRAAVKSGERLDENKMKKILEELSLTKNSSTCPHGRPTTLHISYEEVAKFFKRK